MHLTPGLRLRSQVCSTEVIIVRPPADDIEISCGGVAMVVLGTELPEGAKPAEGFDTGNELGKRYTSEHSEGALELLVTKPGAGSLSAGGRPLVVKDAKPLPSSD